MSELRDESKIVDGVVEHDPVLTPTAALFGRTITERHPDNVRVEREVTLSPEEHQAVFGVAGRAQKMDRLPHEPPLSFEGNSALDTFGPPELGSRIDGVLERLKKLEGDRDGED